MAKRRKRKMSALQRKYFGKKKRRVTRAKRRRITVKAVRRRSRRRTVVSVRRKRRSNPRYRVRSRRRRHSNPRFSVAGLTSQLIPAAYGAGGAIALDVAMGYLPLPAMLKTGYAKHATRIVGAMGIGWIAKKFLRGRGSAVAAGALTVAVYHLLKDVIVQFAPQVKGLGDYEEISIDNTADQIGGYLPGAAMGAYLPDGSSAPGMGAYLGGSDNLMFDVDDTSGANLGGMEY